MKNFLILLLQNTYENKQENIKDIKEEEENSTIESSSLKLTTL